VEFLGYIQQTNKKSFLNKEPAGSIPEMRGGPGKTRL